LDLHPEVIDAVEPALREWGVHPSWTRAVASPLPYRLLEEALAEFIRAPGVLVYPTVTLAHMGALPALVGTAGAIVVDRAAHRSIQEAAALARSRGALVATAHHDDLEDLERKLGRLADRHPVVVAVDGVYSMSGSTPRLDEYREVARRHEALIYIDDAHGLGVLGESPTADNPYGTRGNGTVRHQGTDYRGLVYVSGLSKAFSSMAAFITCDDGFRRVLQQTFTMIFSGPIPTASLASASAGLRVNAAEGDDIRRRLLTLVRRLVDGARNLGFDVDNQHYFPIATVILGSPERTRFGSRFLWERGMVHTPATFPATPINRGGVRLSVTASNTEDEIDAALAALAGLRDALSDHEPRPALTARADVE
jgi:7-keto-8-aminopelargonate synthetase-like enzyme